MSAELAERTLSQLEEVVERGLKSFVEVGTALLEIRERRLYQATHGTFEDYCLQRWQFSVRQGQRLMEAAQVVQLTRPIGRIPANEAQARELVPLLDEPKVLRLAWRDATEQASSAGQPVTAAAVREVVQAVPTRRGARAELRNIITDTPGLALKFVQDLERILRSDDLAKQSTTLHARNDLGDGDKEFIAKSLADMAERVRQLELAFCDVTDCDVIEGQIIGEEKVTAKAIRVKVREIQPPKQRTPVAFAELAEALKTLDRLRRRWDDQKDGALNRSEAQHLQRLLGENPEFLLHLRELAEFRSGKIVLAGHSNG